MEEMLYILLSNINMVEYLMVVVKFILDGLHIVLLVEISPSISCLLSVPVYLIFYGRLNIQILKKAQF